VCIEAEGHRLVEHVEAVEDFDFLALHRSALSRVKWASLHRPQR
jgi:hypothetical protein